MPLIPNTLNPTTSSSADSASHWTNLLVGKKLGDAPSSETTFAKGDLPTNHRVLGKDSMMTMDHQPDRMNIHVDNEGIVQKITHG